MDEERNEEEKNDSEDYEPGRPIKKNVEKEKKPEE